MLSVRKIVVGSISWDDIAVQDAFRCIIGIFRGCIEQKRRWRVNDSFDKVPFAHSRKRWYATPWKGLDICDMVLDNQWLSRIAQGQPKKSAGAATELYFGSTQLTRRTSGIEPFWDIHPLSIPKCIALSPATAQRQAQPQTDRGRNKMVPRCNDFNTWTHSCHDGSKVETGVQVKRRSEVVAILTALIQFFIVNKYWLKGKIVVPSLDNAFLQRQGDAIALRFQHWQPSDGISDKYTRLSCLKHGGGRAWFDSPP